MLYATTRNNKETFTAQRVLTLKRGADGGLFVPYRIPVFSSEQILELGSKTFNANLADMLYLLFGTKFSSYDLDLTIGRYSVRLHQLGQKLLIGECWHNTDWDISRMVNDLAVQMMADKNQSPEMKGWVQIGVRIAILFGIFGELIREGIAAPDRKIDIAVLSGDFDRPMSIWYARTMGLPIGNIICCCNSNSSLWDFICHGQLRTDGVATQTIIPEADVSVPQGLERLINLYGGPVETQKYVDCLRRGATYYAEDGFLHRLRQGIYVTVSSERRIMMTIPSACATHGYVLAPSSALAYAGLQDYRARTGEMRTALILTECSPLRNAKTVSAAMGIQETELKQYLK